MRCVNSIFIFFSMIQDLNVNDNYIEKLITGYKMKFDISHKSIRRIILVSEEYILRSRCSCTVCALHDTPMFRASQTSNVQLSKYLKRAPDCNITACVYHNYT